MQRFLSFFRVKNSEFEEIALSIVKQFPTESAESYYIAPLTEGPCQKISKGKLVANSATAYGYTDLLICCLTERLLKTVTDFLKNHNHC